jgi:hypothetical protein
MTVPLSSILSRRPILNPLPLTGEEANEKGNLQSLRRERSEGGVARQSNRYAFFLLPDLLGRLNKSFFHSRSAFLASRHEVEIMYVGRTSEFLMMTSERMSIPAGSYTLGKLLCSLYKRGDRWVDELDDSHLMCTVNGRHAKLFDTIAPGAEIRFSSTKSIFEA